MKYETTVVNHGTTPTATIECLPVKTRFRIGSNWYMRTNELCGRRAIELGTGAMVILGGHKTPDEILPPDAVLQIGPEVTP